MRKLETNTNGVHLQSTCPVTFKSVKVTHQKFLKNKKRKERRREGMERGRKDKGKERKEERKERKGRDGMGRKY